MSHKKAKRERQDQQSLSVDRVHDFMLNVASSLQRQWREAVPAARKQFPMMGSPCHTCAINPVTNDWQGMENTALSFAVALRECQPFYCHDGSEFDEQRGWLVDPATAPLCSAFTVLAGLNPGDPDRVVRIAIAEALGHPGAVDDPVVREASVGLRKIVEMRLTEGYEYPVGAPLASMERISRSVIK